MRENHKKSDNIGTAIQEIEKNYFIGRVTELTLFEQHIREDSSVKKIINIHGTGGIGKTFLLNQFSRIAKSNDCWWFHLDSSVFSHTPRSLTENLVTQISLHNDPSIRIDNYSIQNCLQVLHQLATYRKVIITIDSYETIRNLDNWLKNVFIRELPQNSIIIIAGRKRLEWNESPAWRKLITTMHLKDFNFTQTKTYLHQHNVTDKALVNQIWQFTKGHPLAVSLSALTNKTTDWMRTNTNILNQLSRSWLQEVGNKQLQAIIEVATILRCFDQAKLAYITKMQVPVDLFHELTTLSFVKKTSNGWTIHDLIRDAIKLELKDRNLEKFEQINQHCIAYYQTKLANKPSSRDIRELFYHIGDKLIQSAFFQDGMETNLYLEEVDNHNFNEIKQYFQHRKNNLIENQVDFVHRETNQTYHYFVSLHHNKKESELVDANYIAKMGYNSTRLLKNDVGQTIGLSTVVPINAQTIQHLMEQPVSRTYFQQLSSSEYSRYNDKVNSGYFIRMLDCLNPTDQVARSFLLYSLFPLLLSGGRIITSTPLPFFQQLLKNFGFQEVPNCENYDFGNQIPSPTYLLDVRGERLINYINNFTKKITEQYHMQTICSAYTFTEREKSIVELILNEHSNAEIASELHLAEVTVKKCISKILKKVNVKNRAQLIKRLMEIIYLNDLI